MWLEQHDSATCPDFAQTTTAWRTHSDGFEPQQAPGIADQGPEYAEFPVNA